jgi:poly(ribitol-phosphate) beta-N-acetylglucosaminyltransferase
VTPRAPDVSVIVPVYDAMPYLTTCLRSLVDQTLGEDRLEVVVVDDGSTDGGGAEIDRFVALHPSLFRVLRQANSGGPAGPCNSALEVATGRYVYFLGADDYLGPKALERLVMDADDHQADVVMGKMAGVNGRFVYQVPFRKSDHNVSLFDSALPYAMSNAKLFRHAFVRDQGLRFPEDLRIKSDQVFTFDALLQARRICVLADDVYYFATTRADGSNLTFSSDGDLNMSCTAAVMHHVARRLPPGEQRDAVLVRHFSWELVKSLTVDFLERDSAAQEHLRSGAAALADAYLTDRISDRLPMRKRVLIRTAQSGTLEQLRPVVREKLAPPSRPLLHVEGDDVFLPLAGFRTGGAIRDDWFRPHDKTIVRTIAARATTLSLRWTRSRVPGVDLRLRLGLTGPGAAEPWRYALQAVRTSGADPDARTGPLVLGRGLVPEAASWTEAAAETEWRGHLSLRPLLTSPPGRWAIQLVLDVGGARRVIPLPATCGLVPRTVLTRAGVRKVEVKASSHGRLRVAVRPVPAIVAAREMAGPALDRVRRLGRL